MGFIYYLNGFYQCHVWQVNNMDKEYRDHELWLDRGQKEPVAVYMMGQHVTIEVRKSKYKYSRWLTWEQADLLIDKLQRAKEVRKKLDDLREKHASR